ncbi:MAG TPA: DUF4411 family protein [Dehalococcoidia bacterium]|nr:DUF4411 family protein [Dehalococcoidia bacterium]
MPNPAYSGDSSMLINAWRKHYPPDIFPTVWGRIDGLVQNAVLIASDEVRVEIERKDDELYQWARERPALFVPIDDEVQPIVRDIMRDYPRLVDTRTNRSAADPFVIALAVQRACAVVTDEMPTGNTAKPNIPDVCTALGVRCVRLVDVIREQGWSI